MTAHLIWRSLRTPRAILYAFDARPAVRGDVLRAAWPGLVLIALAGTLLYGVSLPGGRALRLLAATGLSWIVFGPALILLTRRRTLTCAHACLVTMAYGIGVLAAGAAVNAALGTGLLFNAAWVALSNVVMASVLVSQLSVLRVPAWRTLLAWVVFLDGTGLALFTAVGGFAGC